jgi:hypothetical protein
MEVASRTQQAGESFKALLQEYQVEEEQLTNDLIELVDDLVENRLVYLEGASEVHKKDDQDGYSPQKA